MMDYEYQPYGSLIELTAKIMKQRLQRKFNALELGITVDQWLILDVLLQTDGISQYNIAQKTYKDAPTVTRIIDLLEKKSLIERRTDTDDRRKYSIFLSKRGKEKAEKVLPLVQEYRKKGWEGLKKEDYEKLKEILTTIQQNFTP